MKLTLYLLVGSAFMLVGILGIYFLRGHRTPRTFDLIDAARSAASTRGFQRSLFLLLLRRLRHPGRHLAAAHLVARRPRLGAHRRLHAPRRRADEARRLRRPARGRRAAARGRRATGRSLVGGIAVINILYGAMSAMGQNDLKYVIAYSSVSHMGVVMLGMRRP